MKHFFFKHKNMSLPIHNPNLTVLQPPKFVDPGEIRINANYNTMKSSMCALEEQVNM